MLQLKQKVEQVKRYRMWKNVVQDYTMTFQRLVMKVLLNIAFEY